MSILINTLYAILTWVSAFVIGGLSSEWVWLVWCLVAMATLQSWAIVIEAWRS